MSSSVLLLYTYEEQRVSNAIRHNVEAFEKYSRHRIFPLDTLADGVDGVDLSQFDAVLIHWTVVLANHCRDNYLGKGIFERLVDYNGAKFIFVQDEYRWVNQTIGAAHDLRAAALFSALCPDDIGTVYGDPRMAGTEVVGVLTGYLEPEIPLRGVLPYAEREIDVGYRARDLTGEHAWLGELAQEKALIAHRFNRDAADRGLRLDISTAWEARLFGDDWLRFLGRCKAQLGTESGASICDRDDTLRHQVHRYVKDHPEAAFEEIREACFPGLDWKTPARGLSPRSLEAAAMRTLMINYEGIYHGILEPWVHYVPLKKDHSNLGEVIAILKDDPPRAEKIIARAYDDLGRNPAYQYPGFIEIVDRKISQYAPPRSRAGGSPSRDSFEQLKAARKHERLLRDLHLWSGSFQDLQNQKLSRLLDENDDLLKRSKKLVEEVSMLKSVLKDDRKKVAELTRSLSRQRSLQRSMMWMLTFVLACVVAVLVILWRAGQLSGSLH